MKPATGAGRREGVHKVNTFEEIRTGNPNKAAPEAAMPQAAWKTLLRAAVHGLCPPYTPETLCRWLQITHPQAWAISAPPPLILPGTKWPKPGFYPNG